MVDGVQFEWNLFIRGHAGSPELIFGAKQFSVAADVLVVAIESCAELGERVCAADLGEPFDSGKHGDEVGISGSGPVHFSGKFCAVHSSVGGMPDDGSGSGFGIHRDRAAADGSGGQRTPSEQQGAAEPREGDQRAE
jgi:hypothetical protein